jgi:hypothetical protein
MQYAATYLKNFSNRFTYQNQAGRNVGLRCGEMCFKCSSSKMPEVGNAASMMAGLVSLPAAPPAVMSPATLAAG